MATAQPTVTSKIAQFVSIALDPVIVFSFGLLAIVSQQNITGALQGVILISLLVSIVGISWVWSTKRIADAVYLPRARRDNVYIAAIFASVVSTVIFGSLIWTSAFWYNFSMTLMLYFACFYLVNRYFDKASQHVGMVAFISMLLIDKLSVGWVLLLISIPVLIWARLDLRQHGWTQIMWGWAIGMAVGVLTWLF